MSAPFRPRAGLRALRPLVALLLGFAVACSTGASSNDASFDELGNPGNCTVVDMAVSPEKIDLLTSLAQTFNQATVEVEGSCIFVNPKSKASGGAMQALATGWDESTEGPLPRALGGRSSTSAWPKGPSRRWRTRASRS